SLFIGAKAYREDDPPHYESTYVSGWDVRSLAFMERAIGAARPGIRFGVEEVFLRSADELARMRDPGVEIAREAWNEIMTDGQTSAIVTIGTQRACHATEVCLATMLGVAPFKRGADPRLSSSPVQFVWSCDEYDRLPSSFAVIGQQREISPSERPRKTIALKVLNKTFEVRAEGDLMYDFGLIAAQRRRTGIWLVIAGLSGPATHAAALLLEEITADVPRADPGRTPPVLLAVIEAQLKRDVNRRGDNREVKTQKVALVDKWEAPDFARR
ncbi:MAG TPA: hypothetical protein VKT77_06790, partial [Chthonomonadaceae bacterium]|nr:hypothetical protein [Chthonomonadaceae bacterium]